MIRRKSFAIILVFIFSIVLGNFSAVFGDEGNKTPIKSMEHAQFNQAGESISKKTSKLTEIADEELLGYVENEIIVKFKDDAPSPQMRSFSVDKGLKLKDTIWNDEIMVFKTNEGISVEEAIETMLKDDRVEYAQPNYIYKLFSDTPGDTFFKDLWGLHNIGQKVLGTTGKEDKDINALEAWDITKGNKEIIVAVIDDGVYIDHIDLKNNIWVNEKEIAGNGIDDDGNGYIDDINGWDFANDRNIIFSKTDGDYHGTHVAGIIAATANNTGVIGVAPNVKIMPLKFISGKTGRTTDAINAIKYAKDNGAHIVNCSWGAEAVNQMDTALRDAIVESGLLFICAAGNGEEIGGINVGIDNDIRPVYPASYDLDNIISVAAANNKGEKASFSNYGSNSVHLGAPGVDVLSTYPNKEAATVTDAVYSDYHYAYMSGTSMATPHVTGIAALLLSKNKYLTPVELKTAILDSVKPLDSLSDKTITGGMADAFAALQNVAPEKPNNLKTIKSGSDVTLTWEGHEARDFKGYTIERKKGNHSFTELIRTTEKTYIDENIDIYVINSYRVKAIDEWGNISYSSNEAIINAEPDPNDNGNNGGSNDDNGEGNGNSSGSGSGSGSSGGGGGGGGGGGKPKEEAPKALDNKDTDIEKGLKDKTGKIIEIEATKKGNEESISLSTDIMDKLLKEGKDLKIKGEDTQLEFSPAAFETEETKELLKKKTATINIKMEKLKEEDKKKLMGKKKKDYEETTGEIYEFGAFIKDENKSMEIKGFKNKIKISFRTEKEKVKEYGLDRIGVYRYNEEKKTWDFKGGTYDEKTGTINLLTESFSKYIVMAYTKEYEDIKGHWAEKEIEALVSKQIAEGRKDKYEANEPITRLELVKMLIKMEMQNPAKELKIEETKAAPFKDISIIGEDKDYIKAAVDEGIIKGFEDATFKPQKSVTREEMAAMIRRMLGLVPGITLEETSFIDIDKISDWAKEDIIAVYEKGIIKGNDKGEFDGKRSITRGEAAVMIKRIMDNKDLIRLYERIKGKLVINHIEGTHYELETTEGIYVLIIDNKNNELNRNISESVGKEIVIKGYVKDGLSFYQRGKIFEVIDLE